MAEQLDIIVESVNGLHNTLATVANEAHGALVAEALYEHLKDAPKSSTQARYVWLRSSTVYRDDSEVHNPHLLRAWPEASQDPEGHAASVAAWKASPRGVSGDESEPDEATARRAIETALAKLPERYQPRELTCANQRFTLSIDHGPIFWEKPAREAIRCTQNYVEEHARAAWKLPTGVVNGIYD